MGSIVGREKIKKASTSTPSINEPVIKAQISGKLVTSGISDVAIASVISAKTV